MSRYTIVKHDDAVKYLSPDQQEALRRIAVSIRMGRLSAGMSDMPPLVIDADSPDYVPKLMAMSQHEAYLLQIGVSVKSTQRGELEAILQELSKLKPDAIASFRRQAMQAHANKAGNQFIGVIAKTIGGMVVADYNRGEVVYVKLEKALNEDDSKTVTISKPRPRNDESGLINDFATLVGVPEENVIIIDTDFKTKPKIAYSLDDAKKAFFFKKVDQDVAVILADGYMDNSHAPNFFIGDIVYVEKSNIASDGMIYISQPTYQHGENAGQAYEIRNSPVFIKMLDGRQLQYNLVSGAYLDLCTDEVTALGLHDEEKDLNSPFWFFGGESDGMGATLQEIQKELCLATGAGAVFDVSDYHRTVRLSDSWTDEAKRESGRHTGLMVFLMVNDRSSEPVHFGDMVSFIDDLCLLRNLVATDSLDQFFQNWIDSAQDAMESGCNIYFF